jgi:hypothetical protein
MSYCEHGNGPSGSINGGHIPDHLSDNYVHKKDFPPWNLCEQFLPAHRTEINSCSNLLFLLFETLAKIYLRNISK